MAIDSAQKRVGISGIPFYGPGITPDATPDKFWRQTVAWGYGGIEAADVVSANRPISDTVYVFKTQSDNAYVFKTQSTNVVLEVE